MSPLGAVCAGLLLVIVDFRVPGLDVVPDPVGWALVAVGLSRLPSPDNTAVAARVAAVVTALLSLAELSLPVATETSGPVDGAGPVTSTTAVADPEGLQAILVSTYSFAFSVTLVLLTLALRTRAARAGDTAAATTLTRFVVFHVVVGALGVVVDLVIRAAGVTVPRQVDGGAVALALVAVLATFVVVALFLVTLYRMRERPWAAAAGQVSPAAPA